MLGRILKIFYVIAHINPKINFRLVINNLSSLKWDTLSNT